MAFDHNSVPQDLRPLNIARTVAEETPILPFMTSGRNIEGFYENPPRDVVNPGAIPVCYPPTMSDAGFVSATCGSMAPGVAVLSPRMPTAVAADTAAPGVNSTTGHCLNPNFGTRSGGNASDQASDEGGGEDSVSGKKIKFLCSFCGKIIPRPSDGMLRYVGGQTRIISVRRDVSFNELVQKMVDMYGQNVVIKYQLPDEDLDALVSVSCPDDLENMMDEYQKLVESSLDGSAKLRVFLFSPSELESSGMLHLGGLQDSGQRYFEAVNGIMDGVGGSIARKESIASLASTQNSDFSGTEAVDSSCHGQGNVTGAPSTGMLSPRANSATSQEPASRSVHMDPTPAIYAEASTAPPGIPVVLSGPQIVSSQLEHEFERPAPVTLQQQQVGVELQQPGDNLQPPAPYLQAYVDPHQEMLNCADYVQVPSQMGFPAQLLGTVGPVFTHPHFHDNAASVSSHHFVPAVHMTMTPKPNAVMPLAQPQQTQLGCHPDEGAFRARVVQLPGDQSYNTYQAQVPPTVVGGGSGWHQVPQPEQVVFSEGWIPHQQVMFSEKILRFKDCYMCEKDLPHSHSDVMVRDQMESPTNNVSDSNSVYHSLQLEDKMRAPPMNSIFVSGAQGEDIIKQGAGTQQRILGQIDHEAGKPQSEAAGTSQNLERLYENDRIILQKMDNPDPKLSCTQGVVGLAADVQSTYGVVVGNLLQRCQENAVQQIATPTQYQVKQENLINKPFNSVVHADGSISFQKPDNLVRESPKDYSVKLPSISPKDTVEPCDHLRQIDGWMENLRICHPDVLVGNEQSKSPIDNARNEDILENQQQKISGKESYLESTFSRPTTLLDSSHVKPNEMIASSNDGFLLHNFQPMESYEVAQPPFFGNPTSYQQSNLGINHLAPIDDSYGKPAFSCVYSAHITDRIPPFGEWPDNNSQFQPMVLPSGDGIVASNGNTPSSFSPSNRVLGIQDTSNSLFSNQDPWNLRQDAHFPPPRPSKIAIRKEGFGMRAPVGGNHFGNSGELTAEGRLEDRVYQPAGNMGMDFGSEHSQTIQGSAEELIKQELQAVAEGIAASVLQSSMSSTPDITMHERDETLSEANQGIKVQNNDVEIHSAKFEDIKTKLPEKTNVGFPVSDGIGHLQIIKNSDLEELQELGSGTFGTVFHGKWRGTDVAIKRINDRCFAGKSSEQERMREDFWNEAINLADLHHPNVVAFYGVVLDGPGGSVATVTECMVNGSLRTALQKNERNLDKRKRLLIAMDVAFGMEYLHGKNIVHFDLKSDNLLVNLGDPHRPICKVGDLGLSKVKCQTLISGGVRGTLPWMAPELLNGSSSLVSEKVDVFSFGIVMWELLTGEEPYADLHYGAIIGGIVSNTLRPPLPELCDPEWRSLMERCWSSEPSERPSFTEIANELRSMAAKVPPKAHTQQQQPSPSSAQPQVRI